MEDQNTQNSTIETSDTIPNPVPNPSNPPTSKSKLPRKLILGIILLFLLAGSAAGFYVFKPQIMNLVSKPNVTPSPTVALTKKGTPTPDPTANWQTYIDSETGFTFKYPPTWNQETETPEIEGVIRTIHRFTGPEGEVSIGFNGLGGGCGDRRTDKQVNGGKLTYCYIGMGEDYPNSPEIEIWKHASYSTKSTIMEFSAIANPKNNTLLINQILSTFKFTN